jgi:hypothetical protein
VQLLIAEPFRDVEDLIMEFALEGESLSAPALEVLVCP